MVKAALDAVIAAGGDTARAHAFLQEALDERENPTPSEAAWGAVLDTFMEALTNVLKKRFVVMTRREAQ